MTNWGKSDIVLKLLGSRQKWESGRKKARRADRDATSSQLVGIQCGQDAGAVIAVAQADGHGFGLDRGLRRQPVLQIRQVGTGPKGEALELVAAADGKGETVFVRHGNCSEQTHRRSPAIADGRTMTGGTAGAVQ